MLFRLLTAVAVAAAQEPPKKQIVVVTGAFESIPLEESERSVRAIPARALAPVAGTISDLLNLDASLDLRERAPGAIQSGLSIRGGSFGQTLVLWNGMRLNSVQSANLNMDVPIPLDALYQVEVLKGSGSTLYGSDASAGVVNFITKAPESPEVRLRTGLGNWGTQQQRASLAFANKSIAQHLSIQRDFSTGFAENRDFRNLSAASITNWKRTEISMALNDRPFGADRFYGNFNSWERTKNWFAGLRQGLDRKTDLHFAYRRHTDLFVLYRDRPQVFTNRHIAESYQVQLRRREELTTTSNLHYGVEGLHDSINSSNLGVHSRSRAAAYISYDVRALNRFSFTAGAREEVYRNVQQQFNPTAAAGVWINGHLKLRASASRAFRLPSYTDLYYRDPANIGNPLLRPESAWSYEGGLDWNAAGRWRGAVNVFQRRERDGIDYVRSSPASIWRATNFQRLNFTGVELSAGTNIRRHLLEFSYTALNGAQSILGTLQSKYVFNYPRHSGLFAWQASVKDVSVRTRVGALERLGRNPYAVWDIFSSWSRGPVRPYLQWTNITSSRYEELIGVPMPGRGFVGGVEFVWAKSR
ncbi:MAG: TonB-dependent receptor [Acidobacteria bacterium]|nr:TonB-dependent receptor [Acidobacteriota bacterium]